VRPATEAEEIDADERNDPLGPVMALSASSSLRVAGVLRFDLIVAAEA
jgi:hypothetical protein